MGLEVVIANVQHTECKIKKWFLVWQTNSQLCLRGIIKVNRLSLRKHFCPLPLHISIWFCWRVILLFIFIVRFWYLETRVECKLIVEDDVDNLGCSKSHLLLRIFFFGLITMDKSHNLKCKLLKIIWAYFTNFPSLARATKSMSFLLTYVSQLPLSQIAWTRVERQATYFPFS